MSTTSSTPETSSPRVFNISRTFDAPREKVWKALTEPERIQNWFAPKGVKSRAVKFDLRPGGYYLYCMTLPDGNEMWGKALYREIVAPTRLVYINSFSNSEGGLERHPLSPVWPLELHSTYTLEEKDGKTTLHLAWTPENASPQEIEKFESSHASMTQGWTGTFENLTAYLAQN